MSSERLEELENSLRTFHKLRLSTMFLFRLEKQVYNFDETWKEMSVS